MPGSRSSQISQRRGQRKVNSGGDGHGRAKISQWSNLPCDLIELISRKVNDISDYIRFRAVSKDWRSAAAKPSDLEPKFPWLMLPSDRHSPNRSFLSLASKRVYNLDLPEARGKKLCTSSRGWLLLSDPDNTSLLSLLNPLTRSQIHLPPLPAFQYYSRHLESIFLCTLGTSDGWIVVVNHWTITKFLFCKPGCDQGWATLDSNLHNCIDAVAYHDGKLYIVDTDGNSIICNPYPPFDAILMPPLEKGRGRRYNEHYVVSRGSELLLITGPLLTLKFFGNNCADPYDIYKLEEEKDEECGRPIKYWCKISNVGNDNSSIFIYGKHCSCIPAPIRGMDGGIMANCIYFTVWHQYRNRNHQYEVFRSALVGRHKGMRAVKLPDFQPTSANLGKHLVSFNPAECWDTYSLVPHLIFPALY